MTSWNSTCTADFTRRQPQLRYVHVTRLLIGTMLGGVVVYVQNIPPVIGYAISSLGLVGLAFVTPRVRGPLAAGVALCALAFAAATAASLLWILAAMPYLLPNLSHLLQTLLYPLNFVLALFYLGSAYELSQRSLFWFAAVVGTLQCSMALANTLVGPLSLPLLGTLEHFRYIFFTDLRSSAGFFWNVNYYATTQLMLFWLAVGTRQRSGLPASTSALICGALLASSLLGSSRGASLAAVFSLIIFWLRRKNLGVVRICGATVVCLLVAFALLQFELDSDLLATGLRFEKGLNHRDFIWDVAHEMLSENLLFGYGSAFGEELLARGAPNGSVQNTVLASCLRAGLLGTLPWLAATVIVFLKGLRRPEAAWATAALLAWMTDGMVRTYSVGGLGLIPLVTSLALARIMWLSQPAPSARSRPSTAIPTPSFSTVSPCSLGGLP